MDQHHSDKITERFQKPGLKFRLAFSPFFSALTGRKKKYIQFLKEAGSTGNENILDFGCGPGMLAHHLLPRLSEKAHYTGLDLSEALLSIAVKRHGAKPRVLFELGDITEISLKHEPFDLILVHRVLHDIPARHQAGVAEALSEKLKKGGRIVLKEPTVEHHGMPAKKIVSLFSPFHMKTLRREEDEKSVLLILEKE